MTVCNYVPVPSAPHGIVCNIVPVPFPVPAAPHGIVSVLKFLSLSLQPLVALCVTTSLSFPLSPQPLMPLSVYWCPCPRSPWCHSLCTDVAVVSVSPQPNVAFRGGGRCWGSAEAGGRPTDVFSAALPGSASLYGCYKSQVQLVFDSFYSCVRVWSEYVSKVVAHTDLYSLHC